MSISVVQLVFILFVLWFVSDNINVRKPSIYAGFRVFIINELAAINPQNNFSLNSHFRGKFLGIIHNLNEYISFRQEHGIDTKEYKDIYLGDYFTVQDGTYNASWMVAHFDYYDRSAIISGNPVSKGILLISFSDVGTTKMNTTATTQGGYKASIANIVSCPAIASALSTVFGSYLLSFGETFTNEVNNNVSSMAGMGQTGGTVADEETITQCILPNEIQITGTTIYSSSGLDAGKGCTRQLAVFRYYNWNNDNHHSFWLRNVCSWGSFGCARDLGRIGAPGANQEFPLRPLIYIG